MNRLQMLTKTEFNVLDGIIAQLSPENLTCDGELSNAQVSKRLSDLQKKLKNFADKHQLSDTDMQEEAVYTEARRRRVAGAPW